jgi:hypothetical protein
MQAKITYKTLALVRKEMLDLLFEKLGEDISGYMSWDDLEELNKLKKEEERLIKILEERHKNSRLAVDGTLNTKNKSI